VTSKGETWEFARSSLRMAALTFVRSGYRSLTKDGATGRAFGHRTNVAEAHAGASKGVYIRPGGVRPRNRIRQQTSSISRQNVWQVRRRMRIDGHALQGRPSRRTKDRPRSLWAPFQNSLANTSSSADYHPTSGRPAGSDVVRLLMNDLACEPSPVPPWHDRVVRTERRVVTGGSAHRELF
jgi:hypothetical protein